MNLDLIPFLLPFLLALFASLVFTPLTIVLAKKFGFVDDPRKKDHPGVLHKKIIPRAGGLPIFLAFFIALLVFVPLSKNILGITFGGLILVLIGLFDDKFKMKKSLRFLTQILAALVVVGAGVGIAFVTNPFSIFAQVDRVITLDTLKLSFDIFGLHSIILLADLFAIFWIVWVINMVNFSSGVDGQMPGIVFIVLAVIFATSLRFFPQDPSQTIVLKLAAIGAGATLGFLFFNYYPARIFPGDSGSYFLGFLVAVVAILSGAKVGTAILVMAVPLVDGIFTIIRRLASGKSPFLGDKKHLHHRLLELGWGQRAVALFYWLLCAILGAAALTLDWQGKIFAVIVIAVTVLGGLLWLNMILPRRDQK